MTYLIPNKVLWSGAQRNITQAGDVSAHVRLRDLKSSHDLYAVGPQAELVGEVTVFDSHPYVAHIESGWPKLVENWNVGACFLAYASVPNWQKIDNASGISNLLELESALPNIAETVGIDVSRPFAFIFEGRVDEVAYHILPRTENLPHNEERHEAIKARLGLESETVRGVGFYSEHHGGIFIPRGRKIHVHFVAANSEAAGHVDAIKFGSPFSLFLPRV